MPPIETIAKPRRNRIVVPVPKEYGACSFHVTLVPIAPPPESSAVHSFVDALLSCPKLPEGETLDIARDPHDLGRDVFL